LAGDLTVWQERKTWRGFLVFAGIGYFLAAMLSGFAFFLQVLVDIFRALPLLCVP
jgi:hypothetical protein